LEKDHAAPVAPPASDNAPATPNTVTAFVRPFRFIVRLPCDMVEAPIHRRLTVQLFDDHGQKAAFQRLDGQLRAARSRTTK